MSRLIFAGSLQQCHVALADKVGNVYALATKTVGHGNDKLQVGS